MSLYGVQKLMFELHVSDERRNQLHHDPAGVLARFELTAEERGVILALDIFELYNMGVHPLLLRPFAELNGISAADYYAALRQENAG
jgi:hypothetical protein